MALERNSHCKTVYKWIRKHADTAYKSSHYCMCVSNLTWNDPKKTHRNLSLKEDLSLATKHKCSLKVLTWFTYIIVHNNKHKIPLIHFKIHKRVRAFHQCFVYVEWNFAGFFPFFLFPTPPLAMIEIDFVGVGAGSIEVSFTFKMAETCLAFSAEKTTFDPQSKGCLIVGQPRHLQAVSYDNFAQKLSRRVDAAVWKCFISSI